MPEHKIIYNESILERGMNKNFKTPEENEKGFVFIVCILLLFVLTIAGIATVRTSGTEVLTVRNQNQIIREFYNAETGMIDAFENPVWLLDVPFMTGDPASAVYGPQDTQIDGDLLARYRVRYIDVIGTTSITDLPDVPSIQHIGPPPVGSGYSVKYFEVRRYAVTSQSATGNSVVTGGVWKVFNKF
jgi:hypothetical protein